MVWWGNRVLESGWRVSWIPAFAGMTEVSLRDGVFSRARCPRHGKVTDGTPMPRLFMGKMPKSWLLAGKVDAT